MNEFEWDDDPKVHVDPLKVAGLQPKPNIVQRQEQPILPTQIPILPTPTVEEIGKPQEWYKPYLNQTRQSHQELKEMDRNQNFQRRGDESFEDHQQEVLMRMRQERLQYLDENEGEEPPEMRWSSGRHGGRHGDWVPYYNVAQMDVAELENDLQDGDLYDDEPARRRDDDDDDDGY